MNEDECVSSCCNDWHEDFSWVCDGFVHRAHADKVPACEVVFYIEGNNNEVFFIRVENRGVLNGVLPELLHPIGRGYWFGRR